MIRPLTARAVYDRLNAGIRELASKNGFLLSDLQALFHGHSVRASDTWFTMQIEPNYAGATAIAHHWNRLYRQGS